MMLQSARDSREIYDDTGKPRSGAVPLDAGAGTRPPSTVHFDAVSGTSRMVPAFC
jgi:hypothetical protein